MQTISNESFFMLNVYIYIQGVLLGMSVSIIVSGFVGLGNILAGRKDLLPNQRLKLSLRECTCVTATNSFNNASCSSFLSPEDQYMLDLPDNSDWKNNGDNGWIQIWSTSYSKFFIMSFCKFVTNLSDSVIWYSLFQYGSQALES